MELVAEMKMVKAKISLDELKKLSHLAEKLGMTTEQFMTKVLSDIGIQKEVDHDA